MEKITLEPKVPLKKTEIYFDLGAIADVCNTKNGVVFVDQKIAASFGSIMEKVLGYPLIVVPSGEESKSRRMKEKLEDELFKLKLGRDSTIVAMGGGVTTDLVGFIAATYLRGISLVLMPTTLLGMVDASIGGKTGIDTQFGKNLLGSFYLPKAIFIDLEILQTLPEKEMKNGLSEILKYGLIQNPEIWKRAKKNWKEELSFLVHASIQCKVEVVTKDYEERLGERRIFNFGHTVGHALELLSNYSMDHGEAVALGCMAESFLSYSQAHLKKEVLDEILAFYRNLGYAFKEFDAKAFIDTLKMDKKTKDGEVRFVMIDRIGHAMPFDGDYCKAISDSDLDTLIDWIKHDQR